MLEKYIIVEESKVVGKYFPTILGLHDDVEGFRILLENENDIYGIYFSDFLIYRNTDEGNRIKTIMNQKLKLKSNAFVYKVEDSVFIEWFLCEAGDKYRDIQLSHYAIISEADWVDVITISKPIIKILNE